MKLPSLGTVINFNRGLPSKVSTKAASKIDRGQLETVRM
jgi:hypothetical protein